MITFGKTEELYCGEQIQKFRRCPSNNVFSLCRCICYVPVGKQLRRIVLYTSTQASQIATWSYVSLCANSHHVEYRATDCPTDVSPEISSLILRKSYSWLAIRPMIQNLVTCVTDTYLGPMMECCLEILGLYHLDLIYSLSIHLYSPLLW